MSNKGRKLECSVKGQKFFTGSRKEFSHLLVSNKEFDLVLGGLQCKQILEVQTR